MGGVTLRRALLLSDRIDATVTCRARRWGRSRFDASRCSGGPTSLSTMALDRSSIAWVCISTSLALAAFARLTMRSTVVFSVSAAIPPI